MRSNSASCPSLHACVELQCLADPQTVLNPVHVRDVVQSVAGPLTVGPRSADVHLAGTGREDSGEGAEERRLAGAVGAEDHVSGGGTAGVLERTAPIGDRTHRSIRTIRTRFRVIPGALAHRTRFNRGILRKTKCVAAKHNGTQMTHSKSHLAMGYRATELNNSATGTMINGWNM